jgi:homocysteine S-methyltransferase
MATSSLQSSPLKPFLEAQRVVILDGGLATELEARGFDLNDDLWSARILLEQPEGIRSVHLDYLRAGADCIASASYQATLEGFMRRELAEDKAAELIQGSVTLALEARDEFWSDPEHRVGRLKPLVAASVGPYGAYLADGSEFRGDYDLDEDALVDFHRERWRLLASSGADLLACETIPSRHEARALRRLLEESPDTQAWFSFSCKDEQSSSDGTSLRALAEELDDCPQIVALGINCTAPRHISGLLRAISGATTKPIAVYPNAGEDWNAETKQWVPAGQGSPSLVSSCREWADLGAQLIGGCCRTTPDDTRQVRQQLLS